jgi:hypothetical protein
MNNEQKAQIMKDLKRRKIVEHNLTNQYLTKALLDLLIKDPS